MKVMQKKAEESRMKADAAMTRLRLLTLTNAEMADSNIAAALAKASGQTAPATESISERLAALKKK